MKTGRNDPCPCGSGRKYKLCCQIGEQVALRQRFHAKREAEAMPPVPKFPLPPTTEFQQGALDSVMNYTNPRPTVRAKE